jgi:acyl carrier protein
MDKNVVREKLIYIISEEVILVKSDFIDESTRLNEIIDSVSMSNIWLSIEEEFVVYLSEEEHENVIYFKDLIDLVIRVLGGKNETN